MSMMPTSNKKPNRRWRAVAQKLLEPVTGAAKGRSRSRAVAVEAAAAGDRDAQPLSSDDLKRMKRTPRAKIIRRALGLSQEEFSASFGIPIGTLRDWEQGRVEPDQAARSYLTVIARDPDAVRKAFAANERTG
jgi:putative transcriptional regulator